MSRAGESKGAAGMHNTPTSTGMSGWARRRVGLVVSLVVLVVPAWSGAALGSGPAWRIDAISNSSVAAGGTLDYLLEVTNVGDGATTAPATLTVTLAPGMTVTGYNPSFPPFENCSPTNPPTGLSTFTCTLGAALFPRRTSQPAVTVSVPAGAHPGDVLTSMFTVAGGGSGTVSTIDATRVSASPPGFGVATIDGQVMAAPAPVSQPDPGTPADPANFAPASTQAGGHPYAYSTTVDFNTVTNPNPFIGPLWPVEPAKDVFADLPAGFVANPTAAAKCTAPELANGVEVLPKPLCSPASQVGMALVRINGFGTPSVLPVPVYNMVAPPDVPARLGFNVLGTVVTFDGRVRSDGDYGLSAAFRNLSQGLAVAGTTLTLWGVPADPSHDDERGCAGHPEPFDAGVAGPTCTSGAPPQAFLRNPTSCNAPDGASPGDGLSTTVHVDSWVNPGRLAADGGPDLPDPNWKSASFVSHLPPAYPLPRGSWGADQLPTGCDKVPFDPALTAAPQAPARAGAPAGFVFDLNLPQSSDPNAIGEGDLRQAAVTLPAGVRISPASADGLGACTPEQLGLHTTADPACPDSSKVGSVTLTTPLLDQPLTGSIYLATPHDNPFGSLIAIYLVAKGPGVIVKQAGEVALDPGTGQITTMFDSIPQLPFSNLHLELFGGPRAPLVTPAACGSYGTHAVFTSWSGKTASSDSSFTVSGDGNGAPCPPAAFSPGFVAGTLNPIAGADTPLLLQLTRADQDQELRSLVVDMPTGLLAHIANAVLCPDAAASAGACEDVSRIGSVTVGAGAGTNPFYITSGRAYITGPYKGAPYGLSIVVPAVAGPFDLGAVVVRAAAFVDRRTAQLKVVTDPFPTILQGIPLDVRDVRVTIDKRHFIVNPTRCAPKRVAATIGSTEGAIAHASTRFQVGECANLGLAPRLTLTVGGRGRTKAGVSTPLTATLTQGPHQSGLRSVSVSLPSTLNALLPVVNRACTRSAFDAGHCGGQAKVGTAVAVTPLLRDPLRGSVYFVKTTPGHLPNLMVALRGQVDLDLTARIAIPGGKRLATRFATIPDAPISKFTLRLVSGANGPLGVATNLCAAKARTATASVGFRGQNGALLHVNQPPRILGCPRTTAARHANAGRR